LAGVTGYVNWPALSAASRSSTCRRPGPPPPSATGIPSLSSAARTRI